MNYDDNINDYEMISYVSENNEQANDVIFEKYKPLICERASKLLVYCKNYGIEINDLIQEGMIGLHDAITNFNESYDVCFYTYALKCINSRIITYIVQAGRFKNKALNESINLELNLNDKSNEFGKSLADNSYNPEKILINEENKNEILNLIDEILSNSEKEVINLKINGFTYKEIADILGKPIKFVDNTLQRAKSKIKAQLKNKI